MQTQAFDVVIAGGGMVGASLAVALSALPLRIGLIEAFPFEASDQPAYDDRAIALSYGSAQILAGMGVWPDVEAVTTAIKSIHVSDRGHFGATRLNAAQQKVPALGYLVQSRDYGTVLQAAMSASHVEVIQPAQLTAVTEMPDAIRLSVQADEQSHEFDTRLLVACDGAGSVVREMVGISATTHDYQQYAIVANVSTEQPHQHQAFERFTEQGPIALLPMSDNRCSLVWTLDSDQHEAILALDDAAFLKALGQAFGYRLGRFTRTGKRSAFALKLTEANSVIANRVAVIGNAAHALHPVAGQGLNLALRDIADLAECLAEALQAGQGLGSAPVLNHYASLRKADTARTIRYTDSLVKLFSNDQWALGHARAAGLMMVDRLPPLRQLLARQSMGMAHRVSRLGRGLPLLRD